MRKLVLIICIACAPAYSASIYVDGTLGGNCTGNYSIASRDCSGSDGDAYVTIQAASAASTAGDTIYIRAGTYYPATRINFKDKTATTASNKITLTVYNDEAVIVDGTSTVPGSGYGIITITNSNYIVLDGFTLQNNAQRGIYAISSDYNELLNLDISGIAREAVFYKLCNYLTATNCTIHNNSNSGLHVQEGDFPDISNCYIHTNGGSGVVLMGVSYGTVDRCELVDCYKGLFIIWESTSGVNSSYNTVTNCIAHENTDSGNSGDGFTSSTWTDHNTFDHNISYNNSDDGIDCSTGGGAGLSNLYQTVTHNICFNMGGYGGNGNGIKVSTNFGGGHTVGYNVCFLNARGGFDQNKTALGFPPNYFYNNTAYKNGTAPPTSGDDGIIADAPSLPNDEDIILYNNICQGNIRYDLYRPSDAAIQESDYNLWGDADFVSGWDTNTLSGDPGFADPDAVVDTTFQEGWTIDQKLAHIRNQVKAMFSLQSDSQCIDAGVVRAGFHNAVAGPGPLQDWYNNAPDMGAYEYTPNPTWNHGKILISSP